MNKTAASAGIPSLEAPRKGYATGLVLASLGAIAFSGKAIIVKLAYRYGVDAVTLIMLRMLFALPLFAVMAWWAGRGKPRLTARDWLGVFGLGFSGYYLASFLDFAGLAYISASFERLILYLNPTLVLLFGWLMYRRRATRPQVLGMVIELCRRAAGVRPRAVDRRRRQGRRGGGVGRVPGVPERGELCGLPCVQRRVRQAAGLAAARGAGDHRGLRAVHPAVRAHAADGRGLRPGARGHLAVGAQCHAVHGGAGALVMMAIERIGPAVAAQTGMIGPLSTILMGVVILGEPFTPWIAAGTVLVIAGIFVFTRKGR
jgi:drug/metabolite transporter (DMT)-like permease